jgi:peptidoglycan hydrolase-like protein with peptidoglycan-binding domain
MFKPFYPPTMSRQSFGSLSIDATTNPLLGNIKPVEGATITIKQMTPGGTTVPIAQLLTNEVGQTSVIELSTPDVALSLEPGALEMPYSDLVVQCEAEGYTTTIVSGVQVFPGIQSILPVRFENSMRENITELSIGEPTLFGTYPPSIPEAEIKPTGPDSGFITLDSVMIPEYVIVHNGSPTNTSAANYTVPFKDYIKNVASSEIYPTWPKETLIANTIAIISLTLNRVFTEWYRNQGKNFTITNSTAYDQAFFYGRDIFNTISEVVDEYFNLYVKRPDVLQPLFTQYCDGVKSVCPSRLSQWGSKDLGDQGYTYDKILKYYYGQDIILPDAPQVQGNPESYPGKALKLGDEGSNVRKLQEQLNRISNNFPLIPKVKTTGIFDSATEEAVKTFQKIFHLTQDGIVGKQTWYKISEIYVAVTKIAELL